MSLPEEKPHLDGASGKEVNLDQARRKAELDMATERGVADLGGTVPDKLRIPENANIKGITATTDGNLELKSGKYAAILHKADFDIDFKNSGESGAQPHSRKTEVNMSTVPNKEHLLGERIFMHMYGNTTDGGRFDGELTFDIPFAVTDSGDIPKVNVPFHDPIDIVGEFRQFGELSNFPHGELFGLLAQDHGGSTFEYTKECEGKRNNDTGVFKGVTQYRIKFSHDASKINKLLVQLGNTYHEREDHPVTGRGSSSREATPADKGKVESQGGSPESFNIFGVQVNDSGDGLVFYEGKVPAFLQGKNWRAECAATGSEMDGSGNPKFFDVTISITESDGRVSTYKPRGRIGRGRVVGYDARFIKQ